MCVWCVCVCGIYCVVYMCREWCMCVCVCGVFVCVVYIVWYVWCGVYVL